MTVDELAEELFELVVVKGRRGGKRYASIVGDGTFGTLPEWSKELWRDYAIKFAADNNFRVGL